MNGVARIRRLVRNLNSLVVPTWVAFPLMFLGVLFFISPLGWNDWSFYGLALFWAATGGVFIFWKWNPRHTVLARSGRALIVWYRWGPRSAQEEAGLTPKVHVSWSPRPELRTPPMLAPSATAVDATATRRTRRRIIAACVAVWFVLLFVPDAVLSENNTASYINVAWIGVGVLSLGVYVGYRMRNAKLRRAKPTGTGAVGDAG